ncbi:MAG: EFR1 family ferrodoxin [Eubacteriales bacterium]|nr:EFR1 family ferrodoxin [Eubacteriales bacterium]
MIIYFTGTGNSRFVARRMAEKLGDTVVSLNETLKTCTARVKTFQNEILRDPELGSEAVAQETVIYDSPKPNGINADSLIFESEKPYVIVAPIYAWGLPEVVEDMVKRGTFNGSKEIYFVATMGENSGNTDKAMAKLAASKGLNFKGFRGIVMPNNYIVGSKMETPETNEKIIEKAVPVIDEIAAAIENHGTINKTDKTPLAFILSSLVHNMFLKHMNSAESFVVSDACISCGKCAELCCVNNITVNPGEHAQFGKDCINCLACIQACPQKAINIKGKTENSERYFCRH